MSGRVTPRTDPVPKIAHFGGCSPWLNAPRLMRRLRSRNGHGRAANPQGAVAIIEWIGPDPIGSSWEVANWMQMKNARRKLDSNDAAALADAARSAPTAASSALLSPLPRLCNARARKPASRRTGNGRRSCGITGKRLTCAVRATFFLKTLLGSAAALIGTGPTRSASSPPSASGSTLRLRPACVADRVRPEHRGDRRLHVASPICRSAASRRSSPRRTPSRRRDRRSGRLRGATASPTASRNGEVARFWPSASASRVFSILGNHDWWDAGRLSGSARVRSLRLVLFATSGCPSSRTRLCDYRKGIRLSGSRGSVTRSRSCADADGSKGSTIYPARLRRSTMTRR